MSIIKIETTKNYNFGLWKIEETIDNLVRNLNLTKKEKLEISILKNSNRKKQNIAARIILNHLANKKVKLNYSDVGVPYCNCFPYISISHSHDYCVVATSNNNIGIDIQYFKKNIRSISLKYVNEKEKLYSKNNTTKLHFIWCAKEAIYKTLNGVSCSFKKDIYIENTEQNRVTIGYYYGNGEKTKYNIYCELFKQYFMVIATIK